MFRFFNDCEDREIPNIFLLRSARDLQWSFFSFCCLHLAKEAIEGPSYENPRRKRKS
jgi:hypothetical protein